MDVSGIRLDALDPSRIGPFWSSLLGWELHRRPDGSLVVVPDEPSGIPVIICSTGIRKTLQNPVHFDLTSSSHDAVQRLISLGASRVAANDNSVDLQDPDGNQFHLVHRP